MINEADMLHAIHYLLVHSGFTIYRIGKETGIGDDTLRRYTTGDAKIENMSLKNGIKLFNYYQVNVNKGKKFKADILGKAYNVSEFNVKGYMNYLKDVMEGLTEPFIVSYEGLVNFSFTKESHYSEFKIYQVNDYLLSLSSSTEANPLNTTDQIRDIATEDEEWTKNRNSELTGIFFRKFKLKKHIQEEAKKTFGQIIDELETISELLKEKKKEEAKERRERKAMYSIGTIYAKQQPKAAEDGQDGFFDGEIINNRTKKLTRFIVKDIFDFGVFSFPYRVSGSSEVFNRESWSKEEQLISKWLNEFGPFSSRIRM